MEMHAGRPVMAMAVFILILFLGSPPSAALCAGLPQKDSKLPAFNLPTPSPEADQTYLGVKGPTFQLKDVACEVLLVEILGVYCPLCYQQAPLFNKLFARINKKNLGDKIKMLGVAIGATPMELDYLRKKGSYDYPVVQDESSAVHKLLGEPRTPFTMLVGKDGKVLYTHLGVIEDVDAFFQQIQDFVK